MPHPDWLTPDWPAPAGVRAICTTRAGGQSPPPYDSLNLGDHVGDDPTAVQANRAALRQAMAAHPVFLQQVHGTKVLGVDAATTDGVQADACLTTQPGLACTIMVADCLPVLFTNTQGSVVAAAHAGWRGLAGLHGPGVLEHTIQAFLAAARMDTARPTIKTIAFESSEIMAWLGPCIGPEAFEVGPEVRAAFVAHEPQAAGLFKPHGTGKWLANLPGLARQRLAAMGVTQIYGNDGSAAWCTAGNPLRFFSHRRDGVSGRLAACIWRA